MRLDSHRDIFEEIVRLRREGVPAALATIVATRGSTPGRETMRLLVTEDGSFLGTVGGGCLEAEVQKYALACAHRLGPVPVGESAMVVAVSAPHREAALASTADFIRRLKQDVPIWKLERFEDGERWVGSADDPQARTAAAEPTAPRTTPARDGGA